MIYCLLYLNLYHIYQDIHTVSKCMMITYNDVHDNMCMRLWTGWIQDMAV